MTLITTTADLSAFCDRLATAAYVTVDTEFMREKTYYPQLCLVQVAGPDEAAAIDPLADGIDLSPLFALLANPAVLKVFHAARQDLEIFFNLTGAVPAPLFDTQVAAMVCGFGDSVGYETLITKLTNARIDKSSRFTDWSNRPLTDRQLTYALSDVTHLRPAYEKIRRRLDKTGREEWLADEIAILTSPDTYRQDPDESWRRLKPRTDKPRFIAVLKELCAWREREAQRKDIPRNRVVRDETLMEIAAHTPSTVDDLARTRGLGPSMAAGRYGTEILAAIEKARSLPDSALPRAEPRAELPAGIAPTVELLRVLLKLVCDDEDVASRLVANAADLEAIAADDHAKVQAMSGWRFDLFGRQALALKHGKLALAMENRKVKLVHLD
ncbi:ribonuclease D [Nitrospirillum pindoramense]|uniref:Ribonuclease D n=1 Tax=Nitrospirillum amazonense TaxID=28077 RepID=A0A560H7Y2_9PROT|nr:ribonuclease D [Nitrospirillum amazonense]TWB42413.1 ribonuclease D [Nitrospirillum amazonense]